VSGLTLTVIKLGFLTVLWLLVLSVTSAMRADLFGVRPEKAPKSQRASPRQQRPAKAGKGEPVRAVIVEGPDAGRQVPLEGAPVTFGRGTTCTVPLADEYISNQHARLRFHEGRWFVEDLGSTNGTYIGNQRISRATPMSVKSRFRLGKTVVELRK
jgi:pSer/pThr/pTyr-binding forkhead associated (FHA) protein